jgi:hypothetical protein
MLLIDRHVAIAVAVPVDADAPAASFDDLLRERTTARAPARRGVADRVGDADALGAGADRVV